jgi:hypothetical protein
VEDQGFAIEKNRGRVIVYRILLFLSDLTMFRGEVLISRIYFWLCVSVKSNNVKRRRRIHEERACRTLQTL